MLSARTGIAPGDGCTRMTRNLVQGLYRSQLEYTRFHWQRFSGVARCDAAVRTRVRPVVSCSGDATASRRGMCADPPLFHAVLDRTCKHDPPDGLQDPSALPERQMRGGSRSQGAPTTFTPSVLFSVSRLSRDRLAGQIRRGHRGGESGVARYEPENIARLECPGSGNVDHGMIA